MKNKQIDVYIEFAKISLRAGIFIGLLIAMVIITINEAILHIDVGNIVITVSTCSGIMLFYYILRIMQIEKLL